MANLEVFWGSGGQPSWRVILALAIKQVPYQSHLVSFSAGDHKKPEFVALNPRHKVPTIKDCSFVLYESLAILSYLDRKYPEPPLFGRSPEEHGVIWRWVAEFTNYLEPVLQERIVVPLFFGRSEEQAASIREAVPKLHEELSHWERALGDSPWLGAGSLAPGNHISAADVVAFPSLMALRRAAQKPAARAFDLDVEPLAERYPNLNRWVARVEALPGYEQTYPPHWRE